MARRRLSTAERFLRHVDASGGDGACWIWTGSRYYNGYGQFAVETGERINGKRFGARHECAHRTAYALYVGELSPGQVVRHSCDNPRCVNWRHLAAGSQSDNARDMVERGRQRKGHLGYPPGVFENNRNRGFQTSYRALCQVKKRRYHLGTYARPEVAHVAYVLGSAYYTERQGED